MSQANDPQQQTERSMGSETVMPTRKPGTARMGAKTLVPDETTVREKLAGLKAAVLLAGGVRATALRRAIGRSVLDLPVSRTHRLVDAWRDALYDLSQRHRLPSLATRIMIDESTPAPATGDWPKPLTVKVERDPLDLRGTGGLLADVARSYSDDDLMLVSDGAQIVYEPLVDLVQAMACSGADITILADPKGAPAGLTLVRCGTLRTISSVGFVDFKEQALPRIAKEHAVRVVNWSRAVGMPVRTLSEYVAALTSYHREPFGQRAEMGPYSEGWRATFGLIEPKASVDASAVIHDSVVLDGGRVDAGAVVVRSVVCAGGVVPVQGSAIEEVVARR